MQNWYYAAGIAGLGLGGYLWYRHNYDQGRKILRGTVTASDIDKALNKNPDGSSSGGQAVLAPGTEIVNAAGEVAKVIGEAGAVVADTNPGVNPIAQAIETAVKVAASTPNPAPWVPTNATGSPTYIRYNESGGTSAFDSWFWPSGHRIKKYYNQSPIKIVELNPQNQVVTTIFDSSTPTPTYVAPVYSPPPPPPPVIGPVYTAPSTSDWNPYEEEILVSKDIRRTTSPYGP